MATGPTETRSFTISAAPDPCEDAQQLAHKAERCRRLAAGISDKQTSDILVKMASNYEEAAKRLNDAGARD